MILNQKEISNRQTKNFIRILLVFLLTAFFGLNSNIPAREKSIPVLRIESQQKVTDKYSISFDESNPLLADVKAEIAVKDGQLLMAPWGANHLPNGWASFVKNLRITDNAGKDVNYESKPNGAWQLSKISDGSVRLSYQVDLSFTKTKWISGNEQAGVYQDGALFVVSKALFIVSDDSADYRIDFNLPADWKISTPWQTKGTGGRSFVAEDKDDLINNSVVVGKHTEYIFKDGNFTFSLALLGRMKDARDLIAPTLQKTLHSYIQMFDKTPPTKYLMTVFYADSADSEAYAKSAAFTEHDELTKDNLIRWGNTVAHEFFHSWNGHAIKGEDYESTQWFSEGFTEYYANLALVRQRLITDELFIKKMEHNLGLYFYFNASPAFDGASLKEAGTKKTRYRLGVYDGGWATAFCLDVIIRDETKGKKSLDDLMRLMYERFGLTSKKYLYVDLIAAASEIAGRDMNDFFKKYIEGKEQLPVLDCLKRSGFEGYTQFYDGEIYIKKSTTATAGQSAIQRGLLRGE
jgi:predicted metalloprotease with PDZ domain